MTPLFILLTTSVISFAIPGVESQSSSPSSTVDGVPSRPSINFEPSLAVVIGILVIMFTLTFILLLYAKCCNRGTRGRSRFSTVHGEDDDNPAALSRSRFSGIDKTVIESLPFFRFSSLRGAKQGLECSVCLSKFEDIEILRLLPKCKHAFHIDCIDRWLEKHSSCPLCRHRVSAEDPAIFTYSNSYRFLWSQSDREGQGGESNIELYVQREEDRPGSSSRFSFRKTDNQSSRLVGIDGAISAKSSRFSFRKTTGIDQSTCYTAAGATSGQNSNSDTEILIPKKIDDKDQTSLHKFNHQIIVPDFGFQNRWSNVSSSDLMFLSSEMLHEIASNRFSASEAQFPEIENEQMMKIKEEMEKKRSLETKMKTSPRNVASTSSLGQNQISTSRIVMNETEKRSMSEITAISRFRGWRVMNMNRTGDSVSAMSGRNVEDDRIRRVWLPIARKTVEWFANRQKPLQSQEDTTQRLDV